jgi:hypothetical protein
MLEAVFYTCLGGTCSALLLIGFVFFMKQPEEKKKKESLSPESCALMLVLYVPAFLIMGPFMLSLSVSFASELFNEWKAFSILNDKSKVLTVPLIDTRREAVIHNTLYYASYEYGGASHEQEISKAQYRNWKISLLLIFGLMETYRGLRARSLHTVRYRIFSLQAQ